jgi:hypothetical protein
VNTNNSLRYYVYGVELTNSSVFKIGIADTNSEITDTKFPSSSTDTQSTQAAEFLTCANIPSDRFFIEDFSNLAAAQEAAAFWLSYLGSLGLTVQSVIN